MEQVSYKGLRGLSNLSMHGKCQRYFQAFSSGTYSCLPLLGRKSGSSTIVADMGRDIPMRAVATGTIVQFGGYRRLSDNASASLSNTTVTGLSTPSNWQKNNIRFTSTTSDGSTNQIYAYINTTQRLSYQLDAEL